MLRLLGSVDSLQKDRGTSTPSAMTGQGEDDIQGVVGGAGDWTEFINPQYLLPETQLDILPPPPDVQQHPNIQYQALLQYQQPVQRQQPVQNQHYVQQRPVQYHQYAQQQPLQHQSFVPHQQPGPFQQPVRRATYAEVAHLPHQHAVRLDTLQPLQPSFLGVPSRSQGRLIDARAPLEPVITGPAPLQGPVFRLDMHQEVDIDMLMPDHLPRPAELSPPPTPGGGINRGAMMHNWLQQRRNIGEQALMQGRAMPQVTPRTPRSPALSVSGQSERSTRRSRREGNAPHRCTHPGCGEGFNSAADLRKHVTGVHGRYEDRPYACALCLARFRYPKDLDRHQKTHRPRQPKYWCPVPECPYVAKGFTRKDNYDRHMELHYRADSAIGGFAMSSTTSRT